MNNLQGEISSVTSIQVNEFGNSDVVITSESMTEHQAERIDHTPPRHGLSPL